MPPRVSAHRIGIEATAALEESLARLKGDDPLAPITIIVPSAPAGYSLRRSLGRRAGGVVNVQFKPLQALLELIGSTALAEAGRRPLHDTYRYELIRTVAQQVSDEQGSPFGDVQIEGPVLRTLEQRFSEFDDCDDHQLSQIRRGGGIPNYLVACYQGFRDQTEGRYFTHRDLLDSATQVLSHPGGAAGVLRDIGSVIWYLPLDPTERQRAFIEALSNRTTVDVLLGLTGDVDDVDLPVLRSWDLPATDLKTDIPTAQNIVQAPDAEEEVRSAIRQIVSDLLADDPTPLHRTAILFRHPEPYARIAAEQLDAAGLPWNGLNAATLGQSIAGATLSGLLGLWEQRSRGALTWRSHVAPWLASAPISADDGRYAPITRWNQLARRANLQRGPDDWFPRLERYRKTCQQDLRRLRNDPEDDKPGRIPWMERELELIDGLIEFARALATFIEETPEQARWREYGANLRRELERLLGTRTTFDRRLAHDEIELARWDDVQALIRSLDALDELDNATPGRVVLMLRRGLERQVGHHGRVGDGVFVGLLDSARGMSWDSSYIVGASDGILPLTRREDPLISDDIRNELSLSGTDDYARREREAYLSALLSAEKRVLSYPRADVRSQRAQLPSRWLLESATKLNGERVYTSTIADVPEHVVAATPSFEWAVKNAPQPSDLQEHDVKRLVHASKHDLEQHHLSEQDATLQRGFAQQAALGGDQLTRWTGQIDTGVGWALQRPHSAGALQDWATCPQRYFLARVLHVEERDELQDDLHITALDRGAVIHQVLENFFGGHSLQPESMVGWSEEERERLRLIAADSLADMQTQGRTGRELVWRHDQRQIQNDLQTFLTADDDHRRDRGLQQEQSEMAFGNLGTLKESRGPVQFLLSDGHALQLRGIVDRVDRTSDSSRIVVIDYKTGTPQPSQKQLREDPLVNGKYLQLPIYAYAMRRLMQAGDAVEVGSAYWFITERGGFKFHDVTWGPEQRARFEDTINLIADGIRAGQFPANPGGPGRKTNGDHCELCSFDAICPADRRVTWGRIKDDPALADYVELAEGSPPAAESDAAETIAEEQAASSP